MQSNELENTLREFGGKLEASSQEISQFKREINLISKLLEEECKKHGVERVQVAGCLATQTGIRGRLDADLILFVGVGHNPPFTQVLRTVRSLLTEHFDHQGSHKLLEDPIGVLTVLLHGTSVNVYVTRNWVSGDERKLVQETVAQRQHSRALEWLAGLKHKKAALQVCSVSLSPSCPAFVARKASEDAVVRLVVRLSRKWDLSLLGLPPIRDRLATLDLLAVASVPRNCRSVAFGFRSFLRNWSDIQSGTFFRWFDYAHFSLREVPPDLREVRPLLLHPADPFNNKLKAFIDAGVLMALHKCAQVTLQRLDSLESKLISSIDQLFANQDVTLFLRKSGGQFSAH